MKNILYKILPVCLLTIGLTGCEDETKYRPLPEAVPLTMSINEKAFVMGEHLKVDIKVEPDADGNEVVANEDFDIYFTAKAGTEDVANAFEPFSSIVTFPKGEKQIQVDFPVKTSGLVGTTTMELLLSHVVIRWLILVRESRYLIIIGYPCLWKIIQKMW